VDLDGDGRADYTVAGDSGWTFFARGDGSYRAQSLPTPGRINSVTPADFDGDGIPDVVMTVTESFGDPGTVHILRNIGGGTLQPYATAVSGAPYGRGAAVADIDGDSRPEVLIPTFNGVEILKNICGQPSIQVAAVPANPVDGNRVTLLIHPTSISSSLNGVVTVTEGGKEVGSFEPRASANDFGTATWISPPLTAGTHTFRVDYNDYYSGPVSTDFEVTAASKIPRRRAARH
jgi:hypothetical protein